MSLELKQESVKSSELEFLLHREPRTPAEARGKLPNGPLAAPASAATVTCISAGHGPESSRPAAASSQPPAGLSFRIRPAGLRVRLQKQAAQGWPGQPSPKSQTHTPASGCDSTRGMPAASSPGPSPPQPEEHRNGSSLSAAFDTTVTVTLTRQRDSDADGGGGSESVRPELRLSCGALVESASHTMRSQPGGRRPRLNFPRCQRDTWKLCSP